MDVDNLFYISLRSLECMMIYSAALVDGNFMQWLYFRCDVLTILYI